MEDLELMIDEACRRLNASSRRGIRAFSKILEKLIEIGGSYTGPQEGFFIQVSESVSSHREPLRLLVSNGIIVSSGRGVAEYSIQFSEEGLKRYLANPSQKLVPKNIRYKHRCPQCGTIAEKVVGDLCVGCYSRNAINRERRGFMKV